MEHAKDKRELVIDCIKLTKGSGYFFHSAIHQRIDQMEETHADQKEVGRYIDQTGQMITLGITGVSKEIQKIPYTSGNYLMMSKRKRKLKGGGIPIVAKTWMEANPDPFSEGPVRDPSWLEL